jgi:hypothetical protein
MRRSLLVTAGLLVVGSVSAALGACSAPADEGTETSSANVASNVHVLTNKNDVNRTGANLQERVLTTQNVKAGSFGRVFSRQLDGAVYAQPLYVGGVNGKNVVFVATEHNSVYAFDADDLRADAPPLWTRNFGTPVSSGDTGCGLLGPEVGITATPVIDLQAKTIWFTTRNKENGKYLHKLHALDIATGQPKPNSPMVITAKARGTGAASVNGVIELDGLRTMQRPGLLKVGNKIYLAFASLCDIAPYHGWVLGYDATTLAQTAVHITTPNGGHGGIWNGGVGLNADANGDIIYTAGDVYDRSGQASFNGAGNLGNSIVRLRDTGSAFSVVTSFTPADTREFSPRDLSLGNGGGILLPGSDLYVAGDKRGMLYVINKDNMGGLTQGDSQLLQKWQATAPASAGGGGTFRGTNGGGAYYKRGNGGIYYTWGIADRLKAYRFDGEKFATQPLVNADSFTGFPGGAISVSANGDAAGSAILWGVRGKRQSAGLAATTGPGVLVAFDANDITKQLWSSDDLGSDQLGVASKFAPPTIANGRVFVGTSSNQLVVYGLKNGSVNPDPQPDSGSGTDAGTRPDATTGGAPTWTQIYAKYLGPQTAGHCSGTGGCHTTIRGGFKCGRSQAECYQGLVDARLINPADPAHSSLVNEAESPLAWFGGGMPLDNPEPNDEGAAALKAWVAAGAKND